MKTIARVVFIFVMHMVFARIGFAEDGKTRGIIRLGAGIPYGILGLNYERPLQKKFSLDAGLGFDPATTHKLWWAVGTRIYVNTLVQNKF